MKQCNRRCIVCNQATEGARRLDSGIPVFVFCELTCSSIIFWGGEECLGNSYVVEKNRGVGIDFYHFFLIEEKIRG